MWTPTHRHTQPAKTYIHQLYVDIGCRLEDSARAVADRDGWQEIVKDICAVDTP